MNLYKVSVHEESEQRYKSFFEKDRLEKAVLFQEQRYLLMFFKYVICVTDDVAYITEIGHTIGEGLHGFYPKRSTSCIFRYDFKNKRGKIIESRTIIRDVLKQFPEWEFLDSLKYVRCLSLTVVRDILLGKLTSVDAVVRAYFKILGIKGYSGKELLRITAAFPCLTKVLAVFDINRLIPAIRNEEHAEILMRQEDLIQQAYWLGIKLNPFWSEKRFHAEHQKLTQILMKRKFEKMGNYPIWDLPAKFEYLGLHGVRFLNTEKDVFEEGMLMHHCLYTNYWSRIRNKIYIAFSILLPSGSKATLGIGRFNGTWSFDQCYKKYDESLEKDDMAYALYITDKICTLFS